MSLRSGQAQATLVLVFVVMATLASACSGGAPASIGEATTTSTSMPIDLPTSTTLPAPTTTEASLPTVAENIPATAALNSELVAAFAAYQQIPTSDVGSTVAGSEYEAYLPTGTLYWAVARFMPSQSAGADVVVFQDGGNIGVFTRAPSGSWVMKRTGGEPFPCPGVLPSTAMTLWGMQPANCSNG